MDILVDCFTGLLFRCGLIKLTLMLLFGFGFDVYAGFVVTLLGLLFCFITYCLCYLFWVCCDLFDLWFGFGLLLIWVSFGF